MHEDSIATSSTMFSIGHLLFHLSAMFANLPKGCHSFRESLPVWSFLQSFHLSSISHSLVCLVVLYSRYTCFILPFGNPPLVFRCPHMLCCTVTRFSCIIIAKHLRVAHELVTHKACSDFMHS